jgi:predicted transcriptional regulator YdeE
VDFSVVERQETLVAGVVLRSPALAVEGPRKQRVIEAWRRMKQRRLPGPSASAYLDHAPELNSYLTHILGYRCDNLSALEPGDVLARIPSGKFALFTASGDDLAEVIPSVWRAVWDAEGQGRITRAYSGDYERYPDANTVEVFVAVVAE